MLEISGVSFSYGKKNILSDINLNVSAGQMLVVLGSNGAGKSTLLRIAGGSLVPACGSVKVLGEPLQSYSPKELARMRAFLEQDSSIAFDCRVIDAVLLGRYAYGTFTASAEDMQYASDALAEVGLNGFEDRYFMSLSGGEKRRAMLARVLAQLARSGSFKNSLLILDEPSSGLDPAHAHGALASARKLADNGAAVLAVLHDPNLAVQYADKIALLKSGEFIGVYDSKDAMNAELLESTYSCKCKIIADASSTYALFLR